jgi:hypothetical protein
LRVYIIDDARRKGKAHWLFGSFGLGSLHNRTFDDDKTAHDPGIPPGSTLSPATLRCSSKTARGQHKFPIKTFEKVDFVFEINCPDLREIGCFSST